MSAGSKRCKRSTLWTFFTPVSNSDRMAQCDICNQKMSYRGSITNLKTHIKRKHPTVSLQIPVMNQNADNFDPDDPVLTNNTTGSSPGQTSVATASFPASISCIGTVSSPVLISQTASQHKVRSNSLQQSTISSFIPQKMEIARKKKLDSILLKLFTLDLQPFSIVEDHGFKEFVRALNPSYYLPNRKTISSTLIPAAYEQCVASVKRDIVSATSVCLTTDTWTSKNNDSYMAVTAHYITDSFELKTVLLGCIPLHDSHTSINLAAHLKSLSDSFNLSDKVLITITDNAANIKNAIVNDLQWKHFGCYAHTLNLIVQESLKNVETLQEKVKKIVGHFKRSSNANTKLMDYQKQQGEAVPKKLIQEVPTRWNSSYYMFRRFVELKDAVKVTTALINANLSLLTEQEWQICSDLCTVLQPFEEITKALSGENYITGSEVIPLTRVLLASCKTIMKHNFSEPLKSVLKVLEKGICTRFENIEQSRTLSLCTFLDPRFRMPGFSDNRAAEAAKKKALELCSRKLNEEMSNTQQQWEPAKPPETNKGSSVWEEFDRIIATSLPQGKLIMKIKLLISTFYWINNKLSNVQ